jgi:hypothetical protein
MIKHVQTVTSTILLFFIGFGIQAKDYKGAEIYSNQSYKYGRFEMRMQSAPGSGQLSTFFLYRNGSETNQTLWQEIDIEIFGKNSNQFQSNVIIEKTEGTKLMTEVKHTTPFSTQEFNTYVLEWTPDSITWYVNDSLYRTEKTNALFCNEAMSIRFNHWAANITSWVGVFDKTALPTYQYVDYISYSTYTPGTGDNGSDFTFDWKDDFNSFNSTRWSKANWTFGENLTDFLPANAYTENGSLVLKLHSTILPTDIADISTSTVSVFPNPCSTELYCNTQTDVVCKIISNTGVRIVPAFTITASTKADISKAIFNLPSGLYYLVVTDNNGVVPKLLVL